MKNNWSKILLSPLFIFGLSLLLANDFILKPQFHNFLTGKISDFAGLFIFPLFFTAFFPKRKTIIYIFTMLLFVFWKSAFAESYITFFNSFQIIHIGRTVDYTDLSALLILPFSYIYGKNRLSKMAYNFKLKTAFVNLVILVSLFAFIATSFADEGSIDISEEYETKLTFDQIEQQLNQNPKFEDLTVNYYESNSNLQNKLNSNADQAYFHFQIKHKICDTNSPNVFISAKKKGKKTTIDSVSFRIRCSTFASNNRDAAKLEYVPIVKEVFEKEIMEYLNQTK